MKRTTTAYTKHNPINRVGVTCAVNCKKYPCFRGIDNLETNLAQTCHEFKEYK